MLLFSIMLLVFGIAFFAVGLLIHPNIIDIAINGSLLFTIIGVFFFITGVVLLIMQIIKNIKDSRFEKEGMDLYAFVFDVDPLFIKRFGKNELAEYSLEVYVYEQDDSISKQYLRVKVPCHIYNEDYCAVRKYNDEYQFVEKIPKDCVLVHVQKAIQEHIEQQ